MIDWCCTLKQLRHRIDYLIERMGENARVGPTFTKEESWLADMGVDEFVKLPPGEYLEHIGVQVEWVCIDTTGRIVGDEANNYEMRLKPGEMNAVKLS
jgi:hypothetical protein